MGACAALPGPGAAGAWLPFENVPVKRLSRKFNGPPPLDWAWAWPESSKANAAKAVRKFAIRPVMFTRAANSRFQEASLRLPIDQQ